MQMTKTEIVKRSVAFVTTVGVGTIVHQMIKSNTYPKNAFQTGTIAIGAFVLSMMVADAAEQYTDKKIDGFIATWNGAPAN